jgi:hypothetical protein
VNVVIVQKLVKMGFNRVRGAIGRSLRKQNQNGQVNYMRLKHILPVVEVEKYEKPEERLLAVEGRNSGCAKKCGNRCATVPTAK